MTETCAPLTLGGGWRAWTALAVQFVATIALVLALPAFVVWQAWSEAEALRAEWTVTGPPCETVGEPAEWATNHGKGPRTFSYGGASFTRQFAAVSCAVVPEAWWWPRDSYTVCMFNNPGAVTVGAVDGPVTFQPPRGQRATVTVRHGQATCIVGGRFNI
ncbi:hypothetical protein [Phenylobacterium sp.]|uniref:hypothetical protein n=1 Tax=Phenylobacterium sp. TaxID=1871053 RepID=UPI0025E6B416|nr:hypothetical protein [Phenylobacterium sp.]MBX3484374.1 hypothetical protein [Phenylobacterium sp.]MCW5759433.1 hypothetical protein [Phenylobacterium sp.]